MLSQRLDLGLGPKSSSEKTASKSNVGHTKNVVEALIETLVDPILPLRISINNPPSEDAQNSMATQMHAVALLYNYYHRKQNPELEFLNFESFCKLAISIRPPLTQFMKKMIGKDHLSLTEESIKNACDISIALDASKDNPIIEGYPISRVAVLLLDSKMENCLIKFGNIIEGVWSLIEREVNDSNIEENVGKKRKRNVQKASTDIVVLLKLAFSAVKDVIGIDSSDLVVLDTHVTYSLSKEKSATQFFAIQCPQSFSVRESAPPKFLVESLEGPLAIKTSNGWTTTTVVEYHSLLPYVEFISSLLPGKDSCLPSVNGCNENSKENKKKCKYSVQLNERCDTPCSAKEDASGTHIEDLDNGSDKHDKASFSPKTVENDVSIEKFNKRSNFVDPASDKHEKGSLFDNSNGQSQSDNVIEKVNKRSDFVDPASEKHEKASSFGNSNGKSQRTRTEKDDNVIEICNIVEDDIVIEKLKERSNIVEPAKNQIHERPNGSLCGSSNGSRRLNEKDETSKNVPCDVHDPEDGANLKVEMANNLKSNSPLCRDEKVAENNGNATTQEEQNVASSVDLQNALALLYAKRQELGLQIIALEDMLASYEDNIERIRDGGDVGLARKCIKSLSSGNYQHGEDHRNSPAEKQTGLSNIFIPRKSSYQDLEYICVKNKWRLPRYSVAPCEGKFEANVVIESKDLRLSSKGDSELNPGDARESAAARMIQILRSG